MDSRVNRPIVFLVQKATIPLFYLEATIAADSNHALANQEKVWELIDALDILNEPNFQVSLVIESESPQNLPLEGNTTCDVSQAPLEVLREASREAGRPLTIESVGG